MASWLRNITRSDYMRAKAIAENASKADIGAMAVAQARREARFSHTLIPLSVVLPFAVACSLYAPGLWYDRIAGGFLAICAMLIPILVVHRGLRVQQEGRVIALAYYLREYADEVSGVNPSDGLSQDTA